MLSRIAFLQIPDRALKTSRMSQATLRAADSGSAWISSRATFDALSAADGALAGLTRRGAAAGRGGAACNIRVPVANLIPFSANTRYICFRYSRWTQLGLTGRA